MHLLQVCNVGDICGGTAACAWSVVRALPTFRHTVLFLSAIAPETRRAFDGCNVLSASRIGTDLTYRLNPDICLMHNIRADRCETTCIPTILYRHSAGPRLQAHLEVACSQWLAGQLSKTCPVLYQGVPLAVRPANAEQRPLRKRLVVGRLCTPSRQKWPETLVDFYACLAADHPHVDWEFVGCPAGLQPRLGRACRGNAAFHSAGWQARRHFWNWDALLYHHPSLTESFGRTVAEAMRAGCIPIVDGRGGFQEQIAPNAGFLCQSPQDFAFALGSLNDWTVRRRMSRAARVHADQHFSLAAFSRRLLDLFHRAANLTSTEGLPDRVTC